MEVGERVEVKLSKDWVMVLAIMDEGVLCRTKDCKEVLFYNFELRELK
jgi:hypothetical protein